jgi:uncharacterized protein YoxC
MITCTLYNTKNMNQYPKVNRNKTIQYSKLVNKRNYLMADIQNKERMNKLINQIHNTHLDQLEEMYTSLHDIDKRLSEVKDSRECWDEIECLIYDV